jgi:hypothetical protein
MKKKIKKVTPIKSLTLCSKCVNEKCKIDCNKCDMNMVADFAECYCLSIRYGEKCERFKRR